MSNKLLKQQIKRIIRQLDPQSVTELLNEFQRMSPYRINIETKVVAYKCYEASVKWNSQQANGTIHVACRYLPL